MRAKNVDSEISDYISKHFSYDPKTGIISRDDRKNSTGSIDKHGYTIIKIKTKQFKAHRVAWFLFYGYWPEFVVDHINGNRLDNRIKNLRDVSDYVNNNNANNKTFKKINKETKVQGIYVDKTNGLKKKYAFHHKGKTYRFYTVEEALEFKKHLKGVICLNQNQ